MEIFIAVIVLLVLVLIVGKLKGAPEPSEMTEAAIYQRIVSEGAWISKYLRQPLASQNSESLKRMYDEKSGYIDRLKAELLKREVSKGFHAAVSGLEPIEKRAAELVKEGKTHADAMVQALKEWSERKP